MFSALRICLVAFVTDRKGSKGKVMCKKVLAIFFLNLEK